MPPSPEMMCSLRHRDLSEDVAHTDGDGTHQDRLPIFGDPHHMHLEVAFRVRSQAVFSHAPIRPHSSLRLKGGVSTIPGGDTNFGIDSCKGWAKSDDRSEPI